jgi:DNA-binding GntR family transcriptional regulator
MESPSTRDRAAVREIVARNSAELARAAREGRNVHQLSLDQQDELNRFASTLSPEAAESFHRMCAEEMLAEVNTVNDRLVKAEQENARVAEWSTAAVVFVIGLIVLAIMFL